MEIGLLGPLRICIGGRPVAVTAARCRVVLAALLVAAGRSVPADQLAATVWDGNPPPTAAVTLRNYVKQLRRLLGPAAVRLSTTPGGYCFTAGPDELDVLAFRREQDAAAGALRAGDWVAAERRCGRALSLWRGPALADVACPALQRQEVPPLDRLRLQTSECQVDAGLRLGRGDQLIEPLYQLVELHPLHERFHAQLMLALSGAGRRAEALDAYRSARAVLAENLGIEPGPELQAVQRQILRGTPPELPPTPGTPPRGRPSTVDGSSATGVTVAPVAAAGGSRLGRSGARATGPVPRQLPATVRHFTGRAAQCAELATYLDPANLATTGGIVAIDGMAGVGKTALAVHWAHRVADRFPDGQLFLDLRGFDPTGTPVPVGSALHALLGAFDIPDDRIPVDIDARAALYRSVLADRRVLIVLDNAADAQQARPLLPGGAGCAALVTSRTELTGLVAAQGARRLHLDLLDEREARGLLAAHLGDAAVDGDMAGTADLIEQCARLPLALTVAAARAAAHPDFPLAVLTAELRDAGRRLDALDAGDQATAVRTVFSWSYQRLTPIAATMFRMLGLAPGADLAAPAAASLAALPPADAVHALRELTQAHLVSEAGPGRFTLHDLIRAYSRELAERDEAEAQRRAAAGRLLDHYLYTAHAAALLIDPARQSPPLPERPAPVVVDAPDTVPGAMAWLAAERATLLATIEAAARDGFPAHACRLPWELAPFFDRRGDWHDYAATQRTALAVATGRDDLNGQARAHRHLGRVHFATGDHQIAAGHLRQALHIYERLDVTPARAGVQEDLARVLRQHDTVAALRHARRAHDLFRSVGHEPGQATSLGEIGWCHVVTGDARTGALYSARSLCLQRKLGNRYGLAVAWDGLGFANHHLRRYSAAIACYRRAIDLFVEFQDRYNEAATRNRLGDTSQAKGDPAGAREAWTRSLDILAELRHPDAEAISVKLASDRTWGSFEALSHR
ncbi:MAG TPA: BTAD domain-containing putative transcriptional regulator [Micromonosporaceae bacterium]